MDENEEIQKGFNTGYLLEKLNPELAQKLLEGITDNSNPYLLGLIKGSEQYNQENFFESPPPNVQDDESIGLDGHDLERGKGFDGKDNEIEP